MSYTEYKVRVHADGTTRWHNKENQLHREDGPARECPNGYKAWYINDLLHREDGPAREYANGDKAWYLNGKCHREDGPAREFHDGSKVWYLNGIYHREDGPALNYSDGSKYWFIHGIEYTEEEFDQKMNPIPSCEGKEVEIDGKIYILREKS